MSYKFLKSARVIISLVFFLSISLVFVDFRYTIGTEGIRAITFLQFIPSLLKFISVLSLSAIGFFIVIVLTALFGRIYCSALCPLGILQDIISRAGRRLKKDKRYKYKKPHNLLRNSILVLTVITALFLTIFFVNILDPYSSFGKLAGQLFRPLWIWINNGVARILESMNIYFLYKKDLTPIHFPGFATAFIILTVLLIMAGKYGRLYCNTICPVGTFLGWLSNISLFKIRLNKLRCTQCGKCTFVCKSQCINVKEIEVDYSRCVACFNCLTVCEDSSIYFSVVPSSKFKPDPREGDAGRKRFLMACAAGFMSLTGIRKLKALNPAGKDPINKNPTTIPVEKNHFVCPPGSLSIHHYTSVCIACQLCVSQCPTGVLQPSFTEFGFSSIMQPQMDYNTNYCNYECIKCGDVCPTGAILPVSAEQKKTLQLGKVQFIKENCVVYTENTACGSCSEHCPTQAVKMVPYKDTLTIPETDNSICVGCGACEYACPTVPYKAIYVDGNAIHLTAEKPEQEKLEAPSMEEDFPF